MRNFRTAWPVVLGLGLVCILLFGGTASATTGALFTTTGGGLTVNGNIYSSLSDVYINGGPQNGICSPDASAGLTPGTYYFQVTDPSGATLLSTDAASNRRVTIGADGLLDAYSGTHAIAGGKCAPPNLSVALCWDGFVILCNNTPNAGGEYKAWLIPTGIVTAVNGAILTFPNNASIKTDNFKAPPFGTTCPGDPSCPSPPPNSVDLVGFKFYDANADGAFNGTVTTGNPGSVAFTGTDTPIDNWLIRMSPASTVGSDASCAYTGGIAHLFDFTVAADGGQTYTFSEAHPVVGTSSVLDPKWFQTAPASPGTGQETDSSIVAQTPVGFGNLCIGGGTGAVTLGFWSNNNGQKVLTGTAHGSTISTGYLTIINGSYLRNTAGTNLTNFSSFSGFSSYLLSATATNMAYMLSAQYITMRLNVATGNVVGSALVYCPACTTANTNGFISITNLLAEVEGQLASCATTCVVGASNTLRTYWQGLETALDNANNNKTFVQPNANSCTFGFDPAVVHACVF